MLLFTLPKDAEGIQALLNAAVRTATDRVLRAFLTKIVELTNKLSPIEITPRVGEFQPVTIKTGII